MGIGVAGRILIEAAAGEWPEVEVFHRKGMAQRGGGVFSHVVMHDGAVPLPAEIAAGEADLIIGLDPIECARALRLASPARTAAVMDTHRRPTTNILTGDAAHPEDLLERANAETRPGGLLATDVSAAAKRVLGDRIYANVALLGAAWQRGWIPMPLEAMEGAIRAVTGRRADANLRAFLLGRVLAATGAEPAAAETADALIDREAGWIRSRRERRAFRAAVARARESGLGESAMRMLALRLPEIVAWGGAAYADAYLDAVERVREPRRRRWCPPPSTTCTGRWRSRTRCSWPTSSPASASTRATASASGSTGPTATGSRTSTSTGRRSTCWAGTWSGT